MSSIESALELTNGLDDQSKMELKKFMENEAGKAKLKEGIRGKISLLY